MASDLDNQIVRQIEYYFGDINLPRDKFLKEKIKEDEGWVTLEVLLTFKRLASLTTDPAVIAAALEKSELVHVSEDKTKLRRNPDLPIPELTDDRRKELITRTAYVKGFPVDLELTDIIVFLETLSPIESCARRTTKVHKFKGSCFVIFKDIETCKKFIELENVKYKETELIRKWQADYFKHKKEEYAERVKAKKEGKKKIEEKVVKPIEYPKGAILHFCGIPEGKSLTREDIKEKINDFENISVAYIDFNKGELEGFVRLTTENAAIELFKKLDDAELEVSDLKLKVRVLEGDEEEEFLKKTCDAVTKMRQKQKFGAKNGKKRKGNFNGSNRSNKSKKSD